jgi:hypothetical protein
LASRRKTSFAIISNCPATIARRSQSVDPTKADSPPIPAFCHHKFAISVRARPDQLDSFD